MFQIPNIFFISEIVGAFDLLAMVAFKNMADVKEVVNKIKTLPSVQKVEITLTDGTAFPFKEEYSNINIFGPK